jgi:iron complex transport system substrate-binding protein
MRDPISVQTPSSHRKGSLHARLAAGMAAMILFLVACSSTASPSPIPTAISTPNAQPTAALTPTPAPTPIATPAPTPTLAPTPTTAPTPTSTLVPTATPAPTAPPSFPATITDDEGTKVAIPAEPQRIVSLSPSNTEIVFALGGGSRLVGGTDSDDYPAEAAALPDVVVQTAILKEQIVALDPDLILANGALFNPAADIQQLRDLGYPVVVLTAQDVAGVEGDIRMIGQAIGSANVAETVVAGMETQFDAIDHALSGVPTRPRTFYEIGYQPDIYGPPADSPYADLITLAGGDPVSANEAYVISLEALVTADPEVILLGDAAYGTCPADVAKRAGWKKITAVKDGAVRPANDSVITRPGPRMPLGLASLVRGIHPEITLPDFPADPVFCSGT